LLSTACINQTYMGISLVPGRAADDLQDLARRAQAGDKQAQLSLGISFEEGRGVPQDRQRAIKLYRQAAMAGRGTMWVYVPSTTSGTSGSIMPIEWRSKQEGLSEAKARLQALEKPK